MGRPAGPARERRRRLRVLQQRLERLCAAKRRPPAPAARALRPGAVRGVRWAPGRRSTLLGLDGPLELRLVHARPALDVQRLRLVVELVARAALRPGRARAQAAPATRGHVVAGQPRRALRLAGPGALLVDRARRDLLRAALRAAPVEQPFLDVLVLARALGPFLHSARWHLASFAPIPCPRQKTKTSSRTMSRITSTVPIPMYMRSSSPGACAPCRTTVFPARPRANPAGGGDPVCLARPWGRDDGPPATEGADDGWLESTCRDPRDGGRRADRARAAA